MSHVFPWFVPPCLEAFEFLQTRYGFSEPEIEQLGRECFIRYQKGPRCVSIAYEPYSIPIVELFYPTHSMRDRRIPRLSTGLSHPKKFADTDIDEQRKVLMTQAQELATLEHEFLSSV